MNYERPLSPSSINSYMKCSASWKYMNIDKMPFLVGSSALVGRAVHKAIEANYKQKVDTGSDLAIEEMIKAYNAEFKSGESEVIWQEDDDKGEIFESGVSAMTLYHQQVSPDVLPAVIEHPFQIEIDGVQIKGRVDLIDETGIIIDTKTAGKKPYEIYPSYKLQMAIYAIAMNLNKYRFDYAITTKTPQIVQFEGEITDTDKKYVRAMIAKVKDGITKEVFMPNRDNMLCSEKYCSYWDACHYEFGG